MKCLGCCSSQGDDSSEYQIRMGGVEAQVLHFGNAYRNSDTVVYFLNLKVVIIGDLFAGNELFWKCGTTIFYEFIEVRGRLHLFDLKI